MKVRWMQTPPFNKAAALNTAIHAAGSEWLAFTDDDARPDPGWLREGLCFLASRGLRVCGGRIVSDDLDLARLPSWLHPVRDGGVPPTNVVVCYDPLPESGLLGPGVTVPFGCNLFASAAVFREYGGYDERLWDLCVRHRKWPLGSEDSEFGFRLVRRGEPLGYCRQAVVVHPVNYDRMHFRSQLWQAYSDGWRHPLIFSDEHRRVFEPFRVRRAFGLLGATVVSFARRDMPGASSALFGATQQVGAIVGRWSRAFRERAKDAGS
jgi:GT2 family glycosyltransferase